MRLSRMWKDECLCEKKKSMNRLKGKINKYGDKNEEIDIGPGIFIKINRKLSRRKFQNL